MNTKMNFDTRKLPKIWKDFVWKKKIYTERDICYMR